MRGFSVTTIRNRKHITENKVKITTHTTNELKHQTKHYTHAVYVNVTPRKKKERQNVLCQWAVDFVIGVHLGCCNGNSILFLTYF